MKKIKILLIAFFAIFCMNNAQAQSHIANANYGCRLKPGSLNTEKDLCPACAASDKKEQDAKIAEEKRLFAEAQAAATAKKVANEKERLEKIESDKNNVESGKVYINGNTSTSKTSNEQIPADYKGNPLNYNKSNTGSNTIDEINKGYQEGQQITEIATGLVEIFTPSPEKQQQQQNLINSELEKNSRLADAIFIEFENKFKEYLDSNLKKAEEGNPEAQLLLYNFKLTILGDYNNKKGYDNRIYSLFYNDAYYQCKQKREYYRDKLNKKSEELLPQKKVNEWIENLASKNNRDAMYIMAKKHQDYAYYIAKTDEEKKEYYLKSFNLFRSLADFGDVSAMYKVSKYPDRFIDIKSAEQKEYLIKASQGNCFHAMLDLARSYYWRKDYENALIWYERIVNTKSFISSDVCDNFSGWLKEDVYETLVKMYKKGEGTPKNKVKADEYNELYKEAKRNTK